MIEKLYKAGRDPSPLPVIPPLKRGEFGRWRVEPTGRHLSPGYFTSHAESPGTIALQERHRTLPRWKTMMCLGPAEQEAQIIPLEEAHGHVVIAGLGLGMALYNMALKPEVTRVTVIENDRSVIRMWKASCDYPKGWAGDGKVTIYAGDALGWTPDERLLPEQRFPDASPEDLAELMARFAWTDVDFLFVNIWRVPGGVTAASDVALIAANLGPKAVYYAGQEFDIAQRYADFRKADPSVQMTPEILADWIERTKLPMVGADWPNYHLLAPEAVRNVYRRQASSHKISGKGKSR